MARTALPPGFRFHPTDVELIMYYLKRKVMGQKLHFEAISELNIYKFSPWDLPDKCCLRSKDLEWYFFCPREKKYASGARTNRATENGYWKATGRDRAVSYKDKEVGMLKTLVFHIGHPPGGDRTDWVMYEYRLNNNDLADAGVIQDSYVLCKVFQKSGPGPKHGAQYGAPFVEEEWNDDTETFTDFFPTDGLLRNGLALSGKHDESAGSGMMVPERSPSPTVPSVSDVLPSVPDDVDIVALLNMFTENGPLLPFTDDNSQNLDGVNHVGNMESVLYSDRNDIFNGLADLDSWVDFSQAGFDNSSIQNSGCTSNTILLGDNVEYLELNDLLSPLTCSAKTTGQGQVPSDSLYTQSTHCSNLEQLSYRSICLGGLEDIPVLIQSPSLAEGFDSEAYLNRMDNSAGNALNRGSGHAV